MTYRTSGECIPGCTNVFKGTNGLPCMHQIKMRIDRRQNLAISNFDEHWILEEWASTMQQWNNRKHHTIRIYITIQTMNETITPHLRHILLSGVKEAIRHARTGIFELEITRCRNNPRQTAHNASHLSLNCLKVQQSAFGDVLDVNQVDIIKEHVQMYLT